MSDNLYLFANNNNEQAENNGSYRLYDMQVKENGELIRDFQPVLDSNNIPCLLDKIKNKFYYNKSGEVFKTKEKVNGYRKLAYIEGDGDNYLNLGNRTIDNNTIIEFKGRIRNDLSSIFYLSDTNNYALTYANSSFRFWYNSNFAFSKSYGYGIDYIMKISYNEIILNGSSTSITTSDNFSKNGNLYLFKTATNNISIKNKTKIYYFKIYQSDELVLDLIPVLDQDNVPCMYDKVTDTFFYNQGTGEFSYGIEELDAPPVDYVEYLEGDGASYIDTKTVLQNGYSVEVDYMLKSDALNNTIVIYGAGSQTWISYDNQGGYGLGVDKVYSYIQTRDAGSGIFVNPYTRTKITKDTKNNFKYTFTDISSQRNPYLFANNYGNSADNMSCKGLLIYSFKAYDTSDNLVLDLRPCLDSEGIPCMYDTISKQYFYNQGTGTFSYGDRIGYTPIEYIESNGTQYIDTGVVPTANTDIDMTCRANKPKYRQVEYLQGDGASWIKTNVTVEDTQGYDMEIMCENSETCMVFGVCSKTDISNSTQIYGLVFREGIGYVYGSCDSHTHEGLVFTLTNLHSSNISNNKLNLFGFGNYVGTSKIYYAKLYDTNDNLVMDLIPVLDQDNVPCMYDKVSEEFLYNQGTGTFSYGVEVGDGNFIMNGLSIKNNTYQYNDTDTTVQSNLVASSGATLTMGSTNLALLDAEDIETATNNGWSLV